MKLSYKDLEKLYIEMLEIEELNEQQDLYCEHENAGDRE